MSLSKIKVCIILLTFLKNVQLDSPHLKVKQGSDLIAIEDYSPTPTPMVHYEEISLEPIEEIKQEIEDLKQLAIKAGEPKIVSAVSSDSWCPKAYFEPIQDIDDALVGVNSYRHAEIPAFAMQRYVIYTNYTREGEKYCRYRFSADMQSKGQSATAAIYFSTLYVKDVDIKMYQNIMVKYHNGGYLPCNHNGLRKGKLKENSNTLKLKLPTGNGLLYCSETCQSYNRKRDHEKFVHTCTTKECQTKDRCRYYSYDPVEGECIISTSSDPDYDDWYEEGINSIVADHRCNPMHIADKILVKKGNKTVDVRQICNFDLNPSTDIPMYVRCEGLSRSLIEETDKLTHKLQLKMKPLLNIKKIKGVQYHTKMQNVRPKRFLESDNTVNISSEITTELDYQRSKRDTKSNRSSSFTRILDFVSLGLDQMAKVVSPIPVYGPTLGLGMFSISSILRLISLATQEVYAVSRLIPDSKLTNNLEENLDSGNWAFQSDTNLVTLSYDEYNDYTRELEVVEDFHKQYQRINEKIAKLPISYLINSNNPIHEDLKPVLEKGGFVLSLLYFEEHNRLRRIYYRALATKPILQQVAVIGTTSYTAVNQGAMTSIWKYGGSKDQATWQCGILLLDSNETSKNCYGMNNFNDERITSFNWMPNDKLIKIASAGLLQVLCPMINTVIYSKGLMIIRIDRGCSLTFDNVEIHSAEIMGRNKNYKVLLNVPLKTTETLKLSPILDTYFKKFNNTAIDILTSETNVKIHIITMAMCCALVLLCCIIAKAIYKRIEELPDDEEEGIYNDAEELEYIGNTKIMLKEPSKP